MAILKKSHIPALLLTLTSPTAFAILPMSQNPSQLAPCSNTAPRVAPTRDIQDQLTYFQKVGVFDDADRKTAEEYAAAHGETAEAVKARYAATGDIHCGHWLAQAELVVKNDIVLVSSHIIHNPITCDVESDFRTCSVTFAHNGVTEKIPVSEVIKDGFKCSGAPGSTQPQRAEDDWLILRLKKPVSEKIKPYKINRDRTLIDQPVVAVGRSKDFVRGKDLSGKPIMVRHFGDCQIKDVWNNGRNSDLLGTNCDSFQGSSGGGLFAIGKAIPPTILGINQGGSDSDSLNRHEGPYDSTNWNSTYIPISGELMETLGGLESTFLPSDEGTEI